MFDKEISHYNVVIYDYISGERFKVIRCDTEETAVGIAKEYLLDETLRIRVGVEQVCNLIGWWEE